MQKGADSSIVLYWLRQGFAKRLAYILKNAGYSKNRKPHQIDIIRLAGETNCTATMLRRYLNGIALPQYDVIEKIAAIFEVDPIWLFCGYSNKQVLDGKLLKMILSSMRSQLCQVKASQEEFMGLVDYACEVYEHLSKIEDTNELEKKRLISWMLSNFTTSEHASTLVNPLKRKSD